MLSLRSKVTQKLLNYYFLNQGKKCYINELATVLNIDKRNLVKKINELEKEGLFFSEQQGNLRLVSINKKFPFINEYKKIFLKTVGFEKKLQESLNNVQGVSQVIVFGSYAQDQLNIHSDIDLLIIGEHSLLKAQEIISELQKRTGREINPIHMDPNEFNERKKKNDPLIKNILESKHIRIV